MNVVEVVNYGFGNYGMYFTAPVDGLGDYDAEHTCVEVLRNGVWESPDSVFSWAEEPLVLGFWFADNIERLGLPWRLKSPATSWTINGLPLLPTSGTIVEWVQPFAKQPALIRKMALDRKEAVL